MPVHADGPEYRDKAEKLLNFALFIEWPKSAFETHSSPFRVGILGKNPFGRQLERTFDERLIGGHPVEIVHMEDAPAKPGTFHLVFISRSESRYLNRVIAQLRQTNALIVYDGECNDFCRQGGMVCFFDHDDEVRFHLNADAIKKAGLEIDSKLMRMAASVNCGDE